MSETNSLSVVANMLRPVSKDVSKGNGKLCLSTVYLNKLNKAFDENVPGDMTSSFHLTEAKASLQMDLQFLFDLVKGTVALKVTPDIVEDEESKLVNLRRFQNIKILQIHKIDVKNIIGIQKLRSHIQELTCTFNLENLGDILDKCGGDFSHTYNWIELKQVNFSHNRIYDIDTSFESTPSLQVLDLSHNQIRNLDFIDHLPNLKKFNLSYNKLEKVPRFKGHICKRLQVLQLNNNFIEDISGLSTLSDLQQLDLAQNCLSDHNTLLSISHMSSLYSLDLRGNPINFHPIHRTLTCNYLNKNTVTLNFILDNVRLTKTEQSLSGSLYPLSQSSLGSNENYSSLNSLDNSVQERQRRVRNVTIQEGYDIKVKAKEPSDSVTPSPRSNDHTHLDVKSKMEQLRQEYGVNWLSHESGLLIQDVLKLPESPKIAIPHNSGDESTSSHAEHQDISGSSPNGNVVKINVVPEELGSEQATICPLETEVVEEHIEDGIYSDTEEKPEESSDDDDFDDKGMFMGGTDPGSYDLCLLITDKHFTEIDSETTKKRARWHLGVVKSCQQGDQPNQVNINFDTMLRDRKSRSYYVEHADEFVNQLFNGMIKNKVPDPVIVYLCLTCNHTFSRTKRRSTVLEDEKVTCPHCISNLVIESK